MKQELRTGFRIKYIRSDLNQADVDQLDDAIESESRPRETP